MTDNEKLGLQRRIGCLGVIVTLAVGGVLVATRCEKNPASPPTVETIPTFAETQTEPASTAITEETVQTSASPTEAQTTAAPETGRIAEIPPETARPVETLPSTEAEAQAETTAQTAAETAAQTAAASENSGEWALQLVNSTHPLPEHFDTELIRLRNGVNVDSRIYPDLQEMFDDMRAQGMYPFVREGFRTREYQQEVMDTRISEYIAQGYGEEEARSLAADYVAKPGTSEHELGLAIDINAEDGTDSWTVYSWLAAHVYEYGFILRYPEGKEDITGISYEPWHYRYVGKEAAAEIYEQGVTLEEYLGD